jgi:hypothetical protein|tara:strand:- start:130 stop:357 length:228 start_codon:yes stop_codon:yes gene_type:complete
MEKKKHLIEITYHESGNQEVITLNTDDLAWSMNQYQRNRQPLTWELLDVVEEKKPTLEDVEMIQQGIKNYESDNS